MDTFLGLWVSQRLPEQVDTGAILRLWVMYANLLHQHPGPQDALVFGPHKSGGNPTLDSLTRPGVGLMPLCCEAADYPFHGSCRLHTQ